MNPTLTQLSRRLDHTLNQFALMANEAGEMPWQAHQRQQKNRRVAGAAVGTAAVGAGVYGAQKLHGAVMKRGAQAGPVRPQDAYKEVAGEGIDKLKAGAQAGVQRAGAYGKNLKGAYGGARRGAMVMGKATGGMGMGQAALKALRSVRLSSVAQVAQLERALDRELTAFARGDQVKKLLRKTGTVASGFVDIARTRNTSGLTSSLRKAVAKGVGEIRGVEKKARPLKMA